MAYEEKKTEARRSHNVIMEERSKLTISGVEEVESFDEQEIICVTTKGTLIIKGNDLHIDKLDLENGDLNVGGVITDLNYEEAAQGGSLWSRLFR